MALPLVAPVGSSRESPFGFAGSSTRAGTSLVRRFNRLVTLALCATLLLSGVAMADGGDAQGAGEVLTHARVLRVGPGLSLHSIAAAARVVRDGDLVEIESGDYFGDVAVWPRARVVIRGVGGPVRLHAEGRSAEGKAIWVFRGGDVLVENIEFLGARVPDRNGAGIRHESGRLEVRNCAFIGNETGILTGNRIDTEVHVESSRFVGNGAGDGFSHNLYVGTIARLVVRGSYFARARVGHLLKSRARQTHLYYNRLTDEPGGRASYELEFPNGGLVLAVGNLIQQGGHTENRTIVSYGAEGYRWPNNEIRFVHNTVVNDLRWPGRFVHVRNGADEVLVANNVFVGVGTTILPLGSKQSGNVRLPRRSFVAPDAFDFRLRSDAPQLWPAAVDDVDVPAYRPTAEYAHPAATVPFVDANQIRPGAFQPAR